MHTFLRAIGFSNITNRKSLDALLGEVMAHPDKKIQFKIGDGEDFTEITKRFSNLYGITVRGVYDEKGMFHVEHYFPYLEGEVDTIREELTISRKSEDREFSVMCDDVRLGVLLIFYLQNAIDYIKCVETCGDIASVNNASISGLSVDGKIILPISKNEEEENENSKNKREHNKMIYEARNGNEEAIEKLAVEDIDTYAEISRRVQNEDLYSIVNTSFYPFGSESDNYSILGTILDYNFSTNEYSSETVCQMMIECNDLIFNVCINQMDLYGTPMVGARFKGTVWLQGKVEFL